jgi:hypothetical protein
MFSITLPRRSRRRADASIRGGNPMDIRFPIAIPASELAGIPKEDLVASLRTLKKRGVIASYRFELSRDVLQIWVTAEAQRMEIEDVITELTEPRDDGRTLTRKEDQ